VIGYDDSPLIAFTYVFRPELVVGGSTGPGPRR
jgi:hypothetical protein